MEHIALNIDHLGMGTAPVNWSLVNRIRMQRLYYIRGGNGYYKTADGTFEKMIPHKIYIFPYNFYAEFQSDSETPVDHIYFDFLSAPPIVADEPLVYDILNDSALYTQIQYLEKVLKRFNLPKMTRQKVSSIVSAKEGSFDEECQIIYHSLYLLLLSLSHEHKIPFLNDKAINEVLLYIRDNCGADLSLDKLAQISNFEKHYFIRRFKNIMGETPYAYIKKFRLMRARELLGKGLSYQEAARQVGYKNGKTLWNALSVSKR